MIDDHQTLEKKFEEKVSMHRKLSKAERNFRSENSDRAGLLHDPPTKDECLRNQRSFQDLEYGCARSVE
jgi:hypothetical protein